MSFLPVVIDGIKGDGAFSVLCLGVAVVNGALIFMIVGRIKLCNRIFPVSPKKNHVEGEGDEKRSVKVFNFWSHTFFDCEYIRLPS